MTLRPEHEKWIAEAIETGSYRSPDEVIGRALEILHFHQGSLPDHNAEVSEKIERAFEQFERGVFFSAEKSRADMEKRKTSWLHENVG